MPTKTRRTEIQIETHEVKVIRFRGKQFSVPCEHCQEQATEVLPTAGRDGILIEKNEPVGNYSDIKTAFIAP